MNILFGLVDLVRASARFLDKDIDDILNRD